MEVVLAGLFVCVCGGGAIQTKINQEFFLADIHQVTEVQAARNSFAYLQNVQRVRGVKQGSRERPAGIKCSYKSI